MKKILVAGAALLMAAGGYAGAENAFAAGDDEVGVKISGDARFRAVYKDQFDFGNHNNRRVKARTGTPLRYGNARYGKQTDSRIRIRFKATTAGGAYAVGRVRLADGTNENVDADNSATQIAQTWADEAYIGVPFGDDFTLEVGKYRVTYGTGFFYEDLPVAGARAIIKVGDWEINPFIEWQSESTAHGGNPDGDLRNDTYWDHDAIRYGVHAGGMVADGWKVGGLVAYQSDSRTNTLYEEHEVDWWDRGRERGHQGWLASVYVDGKSGPFGLKAEFAYNDGSLKHFNRWKEDYNGTCYGNRCGDLTDNRDYDDGFGGYIQPSYTIDALTLALNAGFAIGGFTPDTNFGFIMLGSSQLNINNGPFDINALSKNTWWVGFVAKYAISDALSVTGNFAYADFDPYDQTYRHRGGWDEDGWGSGVASIKRAFELSASLDYAVTKSLAFKWAIGTLFASFEEDGFENDNPWGTLLQFNYKF